MRCRAIAMSMIPMMMMKCFSEHSGNEKVRIVYYRLQSTYNMLSYARTARFDAAKPHIESWSHASVFDIELPFD